MRGFADNVNFKNQPTDSVQNIMDKYPELNLRPSSLLSRSPIEGNLIEYKKKKVRLFILISMIGYIVTAVLAGVLYESGGSDHFIDSDGMGVVVLGFCLLGIVFPVYFFGFLNLKIRNSQIYNISDYHQVQKKSKDRTFPYIIVVKDSKFGVWNFKKSAFQIPPQYDYLQWREKKKLLNAMKLGKSFVIDIFGSQLS